MWIAEHHEKHFCQAAPEVIVAAVASVTKRMRVGSAGALMHFHSPLRIAAAYRALSALYPSRIDLGLASGLTGHEQIQNALSPGFNATEAFRSRLYMQRVDELFSYFRNEAVFSHELYAGPPPTDQPCPPVVMLGSGSGRGNMMLAAKHGTAFCYSLAHGVSTPGRQILAEYRDTFRPSPECKRPQTMIAATCLCAENTIRAYTMFNRITSHIPALCGNVIGDPQKCLERISGLLAKYECEEIVLFPIYESLAEKEAGYYMLSEVFGLTRLFTACNPDSVPMHGGRLG
jgi:luciferase family oxidoreductase group 1